MTSPILSAPAVTLSSMDIVLPLLTLVLGLLVGAIVALAWTRRAGDPDVLRALSARGEDQAVLRDGLDRLHERLMDVEQQRASWQGQLRQQVEDMRHSTDLLRRETGALSTALRKPHVRGQWGELHLRRAVELAGMVEHCDFEEQVHLAVDDGHQRPDLVVRLVGGRSVVVDAKVPLDAHLDALSAPDADEAAAHLRRHVRQVRSHVDALSGKAYWRALPGSPEFVVMFVPAESFLAAALETDPTLLTYAAARDVVLATPTTLIALLRTVAHGWTTESLAERTREIHELGRELHTRVGVMGAHLDKVGRSLKGAVEAFNSAVGSIESRVLVTARQFEDIGVAREPLAPVQPVEQVPRPLTATELLDAVAAERPELPPAPSATSQGAPSQGTQSGESRRSSA
jgi:DNA recombination protein RmuC